MQITKSDRDKDILLKIEGIIDSDNYHDFEEVIVPLDIKDGKLYVDFKEVTYITSAAIRVLLVVRKKIDKERLIILNANKEIKQIFESAGFLDMLTFVDEEDALDPRHKSYATLLKEMTKIYPDKIAYKMGNDIYTWVDIDKCSQIIASDLSKIGVKKGTHVGLMSMNSINWICTFFAIQKLGAISCSLNFNSKSNEVIMLSDIGDIDVLCYGKVSAIENVDQFFNKELINNSYVKNSYYMGIDVNYKNRYDEYEHIKDKFSEVIHADSPSLIIFTSGSTGKPKAVLSSSFNRINAIYSTSMLDEHTPDENTRTCIYLPLFHIFGFVHSVIIPLIFHSSIYLSTSSKVEEVLDVIYKEKCTHFISVPTYLFVMMSYEGFRSELVDSLRSIGFGGEPITVAQIKECNKKFRNAKLSNVYGLSELSPISKTLEGDTFEHLTETVGKVYKVIDLKIVDINTNEFLPYGQVGEICVKAEGAMVGYYKLDIDSQAIDNRGYIKTGDLGYLRDDGYLVLVGRCKELIIRSGENISPNEITEAISSYEDILQAKVYGVPDKNHGEAVAAAVIMKEGKKLDKQKINAYLSTRLSKFKIPEYYVEFKKFPLLSNNKIDGVNIRKEMMNILGIS